jgi:O-antigen ligase
MAGAAGERRDSVAFAMSVAFAALVYMVPAEWWPEVAVIRPALLTSGLAIGLMLARRVGLRERFLLDGVRGGALAALSLLALSSVGWGVAPDEARDGALELCKLALFYLALVNVVSSPRRLEGLVLAMLAASLVTSVGTLRWYESGVDLVEGYRARWYGVYADPNRMAMNLLVIIPLAAAFTVNAALRPWKRLLALAAGGLAVACLVASHSRGGMLGLALGLGLWALRERAHRGKALLVGAGLGLALALFAPRSFWERSETVGQFEQDASAMGRVYGWQVASRISLDRPLVGVGMNGFRYAWPAYAPPEALAQYHALVSHNLFLDVVAELGWLGLGLFLVFAGGAVGSAFIASGDAQVGWLARGLAASVAGYLVTQLSAGYLLSSHLYLLFGLAAAARRLSQEPSTRGERACPLTPRAGASVPSASRSS